MSHDIECPYCGEGQEINHDDGYGYQEDETYEQECSDCLKNFTYTTGIIYHYEAAQAPCLNGEDHNMTPVVHTPRYWPNWARCSWCDHEVRGEYNPDWEANPQPTKQDGE